VVQRRREIGIRLAIGAQASRIARLVTVLGHVRIGSREGQTGMAKPATIKFQLREYSKLLFDAEASHFAGAALRQFIHEIRGMGTLEVRQPRAAKLDQRSFR